MAANPVTTMKKTLGLTGVTVNAMALIAPGAFLWITYQEQAASTAPGATTTTALDMWPGMLFALILAFMTAISYSELAREYPEAGTASAYYFAEKAFMDKAEVKHHKWARVAKLATGWAAHLFYWVYPGVMVAFFATLVSYLVGAFGINLDNTTNIVMEMIVGVIFAAMVGYIAFRGVNGSTTTALAINAIQLVALVFFSILAIAWRVMNPEAATFVFSNPVDVLVPHDWTNLLLQATIAILVFVGFESCTAFAAEAKNPSKDIPKAVIIALVIQGLFAYMFEYFAANFSLSDKLTFPNPDGSPLAGWDAAGASSAPIGDMLQLYGNDLLGGIGFGLMVVTAITVALALLGTTLSAINTGVRITFAMAQDSEVPQPMGLLHSQFLTPHAGIVVITILSAIIGCIGVAAGATTLAGITLASNFGTFVLYGLTCLWTVITFSSKPGFSFLKHGIIPVIGLLANLLMLLVIIAVSILAGGTSQESALIAMAFAIVWLAVSVVYVVVNNRKTGRSLMAAPCAPVAMSR